MKANLHLVSKVFEVKVELDGREKSIGEFRQTGTLGPFAELVDKEGRRLYTRHESAKLDFVFADKVIGASIVGGDSSLISEIEAK